MDGRGSRGSALTDSHKTQRGLMIHFDTNFLIPPLYGLASSPITFCNPATTRAMRSKSSLSGVSSGV